MIVNRYEFSTEKNVYYRHTLEISDDTDTTTFYTYTFEVKTGGVYSIVLSDTDPTTPDIGSEVWSFYENALLRGMRFAGYCWIPVAYGYIRVDLPRQNKKLD